MKRTELPVIEEVQHAGYPTLRLEYTLVFEPDDNPAAMPTLLEVRATALSIDQGNGYGAYGLTITLRSVIKSDVTYRASYTGGGMSRAAAAAIIKLATHQKGQRRWHELQS